MTEAQRAPSRPGVEVDGRALRELRWHQEHTIVALAEKARISFGYLSQIETGRRNRVSPRTFRRLLSALGIEDKPDAIQPHTEAAA